MAESKSKKTELAEGVSYTKPTSQRDLEQRLENGNEAQSRVGVAVSPHEVDVVSEDGFVGVAPEYQNFAVDTDAPFQADEGPDKLAEDQYVERMSGKANEPSDQVKNAYAAVSGQRSEGKQEVTGGEPEPAVPTPPHEGEGATPAATQG